MHCKIIKIGTVLLACVCLVSFSLVVAADTVTGGANALFMKCSNGGSTIYPISVYPNQTLTLGNGNTISYDRYYSGRASYWWLPCPDYVMQYEELNVYGQLYTTTATVKLYNSLIGGTIELPKEEIGYDGTNTWYRYNIDYNYTINMNTTNFALGFYTTGTALYVGNLDVIIDDTYLVVNAKSTNVDGVINEVNQTKQDLLADNAANKQDILNDNASQTFAINSNADKNSSNIQDNADKNASDIQDNADKNASDIKANADKNTSSQIAADKANTSSQIAAGNKNATDIQDNADKNATAIQDNADKNTTEVTTGYDAGENIDDKTASKFTEAEDAALGGKTDAQIKNEVNNAFAVGTNYVDWDKANKISTFFDDTLTAFGYTYKTLIIFSCCMALGAFLIGRRYT